MAPTPDNVCYIWFAPITSERKTRAYQRSGGYDPTRHVSTTRLDVQALRGCSSTSSTSACYCTGCIPEIRRATRTQCFHRAGTVALYDRYIESLPCVGGPRGSAGTRPGRRPRSAAGFLGVDRFPARTLISWPPSRTGCQSLTTRSRHPRVDFLEHVADKAALINELDPARARRPTAVADFERRRPRGVQDPTHVAFYNETPSGPTRAPVPQLRPSVDAGFKSRGL